MRLFHRLFPVLVLALNMHTIPKMHRTYGSVPQFPAMLDFENKRDLRQFVRVYVKYKHLAEVGRQCVLNSFGWTTAKLPSAKCDVKLDKRICMYDTTKKIREFQGRGSISSPWRDEDQSWVNLRTQSICQSWEEKICVIELRNIIIVYSLILPFGNGCNLLALNIFTVSLWSVGLWHKEINNSPSP